MTPNEAPELSVVIPVYNEAAVIRDVARAWAAELQRLEIDFELRLYDDGSSDSTGELIQQASLEEPRIVAIQQTNRGHGPTILRGYREARGQWIFQVDSDDELGTEGFADLWQHRQDHDLLLARRHKRNQSLDRRLITLVSRATVRLLFGRDIGDVNTPYRLMRRQALDALLPLIDADAFAPNVILVGLAARSGLRIYEGSVNHRQRRSGRAIASTRLWRGAMRSLFETFRTAWRARRLSS